MFDVSVPVPPLLIDTTTSSSPESVYYSCMLKISEGLAHYFAITRSFVTCGSTPSIRMPEIAGIITPTKITRSENASTLGHDPPLLAVSEPTAKLLVPTVCPAAVSEKIENFHLSSSRRCPLFLPEFPIGSGRKTSNQHRGVVL